MQLTIETNYEAQSYQDEIHDDNHRFKVINIGRRGGKTEFALNELIEKSINKPGLYWYIGPSYRQAKSIGWTRLKTLLQPALKFWKFNEQELYAEEIHTKTRIELKGADNEESLLGVGLNGVVFDESAMIRATVWPRIVRPMLADKQGWAIFISTPKGKNWFYDLFMKGMNQEEKDWKSYKYPTSINKYIDADEIAEMKKDMPERLFMQEVMAEFLDDSIGVFRGLKSCITGKLQMPVIGRFYVMGIDLAKTLDFTVLTIVDSITREVVFWDRFNNIDWKEQKFKIMEWATLYNNALCVIDSTGVGDPIVEDLQHSGLSVYFDKDGRPGFKFTNTSKNNLIDALSMAIEQRQITIPPKLDCLIDELQSFEYVLTPTGNIKYGAPEGKHDDCVISLALAVWGIRNQLKEAQIVSNYQRNDEIDREGRGELVVPEYEQQNYRGY